ncbi:MAG: TonB-dependent receptor [Candidatus Nitrotoga sp.]
MKSKFRQRLLNTLLLIRMLSILLVAAAVATTITPQFVFAQEAMRVMPRIDVIGSTETLKNIPGSGEILEKEALEASRVFTVNEALRKFSGVHTRDEEGLGLRPNIGIRGLNPTRSTKITLLEDGIPLSYAPYGDNASYYHPPIDRYERIEVLKGAGQIGFGPQTIGGVINYITPTPPQQFGGSVSVTGGNRNYFNGKAHLGGSGMLLDVNRKQSDGARDNTHSTLNDLSFKQVLGLSDTQALTLRASHLIEDTQNTYSGITEAEFRNFGARYNPFKNDQLDTKRTGISTTHEMDLGAGRLLLTNVYYSKFDRDWWRQASTTTSSGTTNCSTFGTFNADRLAGISIDVDTCNRVEGRLRSYYNWGVEPRLKMTHDVFGVASELETGVKAHFENQERKQVNGITPTARTGATVENNLRETSAYSAFAQNRILLGQWAVTPGLRYEHIRSSRTNYCTTIGGTTTCPGTNPGVTGEDTLGQWIPSLGGTYQATPQTTYFAGVHRGFAPPRTEDVIGGTGTSTNVGPELSVNWELGVRAKPLADADLQATLFRNDFSRQIAVGSIAGGNTPLAQGESLYQGVEFSGQIGVTDEIYVRGVYTGVLTAEQKTAFRRVDTNAIVNNGAGGNSAAGNRMPYAPKHLLTAAIGYKLASVDTQLEAVHVGEQFSDFANTEAASANGQLGKIAAYTILNATLNYHFQPQQIKLFVAVKNLADKTYIVDRTRGILPGSPRLVQAGINYSF